MTDASLLNISEAVEAVLDRLKVARPALASRVDRAGHILTVHLSCPRQRVIRVRVAANGKLHALVRGSGGQVYKVGADYSCSCEDRRHSGLTACKHSVAVWALTRAGRHKPAHAVRATRAHRRADDSLRGITVAVDRLDLIAERMGV